MSRSAAALKRKSAILQDRNFSNKVRKIWEGDESKLYARIQPHFDFSLVILSNGMLFYNAMTLLQTYHSSIYKKKKIQNSLILSDILGEILVFY